MAVKEKLAAQRGKREAIRKTMSVPNFVQMSQSLSCDSFSSLQMRSSCSFQVGLNLYLTISTSIYVHIQSANHGSRMVVTDMHMGSSRGYC